MHKARQRILLFFQSRKQKEISLAPDRIQALQSGLHQAITKASLYYAHYYSI